MGPGFPTKRITYQTTWLTLRNGLWCYLLLYLRATMKKHLTAQSVEKIRPPKEGSIEIFDLGYPGLALRIGHGGAKTFESFTANGKLARHVGTLAFNLVSGRARHVAHDSPSNRQG